MPPSNLANGAKKVSNKIPFTGTGSFIARSTPVNNATSGAGAAVGKIFKSAAGSSPHLPLSKNVDADLITGVLGKILRGLR